MISIIDYSRGESPEKVPSLSKLAADQAIKNSSAMSGGGINPASPPGTSGNTSQGCSTGGGGPGSNTSTASPVGSNAAPGYDNISFLSKNTGMPNAGIMNIGNQAVGAMGPGYGISVTPQGGRSGRNTGSKNHPTGNAIDSYLTYNGRRATAAEQTTYLANARKLGATGASCYSSGFCHIDNYHKNPTSSWTGDAQSRNAFNNPDKYASPGLGGKGETAAPGSQDGSQQESAAPGGQSQPCSQDGGGGCAPASTAAPQAAASLAQNQGMQMPTSLSDAMSALQSTAIGGASQLVGQAAAAAGGAGAQAISQAVALGTQALSAGGDLTGMITQGIGAKIAGMGAGIAPGIAGNLASGLVSGGAAGLAGMAQGLVMDKVSGFANQLLSSASPQLGQFMNMFNAASGAAGIANQFNQTLQTSLGQTFGNAGSLFSGAGLATNNLSKLSGGANPRQNLFLDLGQEELNGQIREGIASTVNLIGDPGTVLKNVINTGDINAFGSVNRDWGSLATRGFGNLTNNLPFLGTDLKKLGRLADVNDLFRIGTPGQIAQQLITNNSGYITGLGDFLSDKKLKMSDLSKVENDDLIAEFLGTVDDPDVIDMVKTNLLIHPDIALDSLADLLDPTVLFPTSYDYNYFENLRDMAVHLSMCNGMGNIENLLDLGNLFESLETPYELTTLDGDATPYNMNDILEVRDFQLPNGRYHPNGELTVADFIGTAAGYVHSQTFPEIADILESLYQDTTYLDTYANYMTLLNETLSGNYLVLGIPPLVDTVVVPGFGTYTSLDDAVSDIVDAIEAELTSAKQQISQDPDALLLYDRLESLHHESSLSLLHEAKLRRAFNVDIGTSKRNETYISDGIVNQITLSDDIGEDSIVNVFFAGVWQSPSQYTINYAIRKITLNSVPSAGSHISIQYGTGKSLPGNSVALAWQFANSLESYALETGFGGPADLLRRVLSNDEHGQRMQAMMITARNKERTRNFGLNCPEWDQANGETDSYIDYITHTGIWTDDVTRAAEIWLQNTQNVTDTYSYQLMKLQKNKTFIAEDVESTLQNITRQLLFYSDGNIVMSDLFADLYQNEDNFTVQKFNRDDLLVPYTDTLPTEGYILGGYKEILSEIMSIENLKNDKFTQPLSDQTMSYLGDINVDIKQVVRVLQKILISNAYLILGVTEGDYRAIFGMPSASKVLLRNLSNDY